ncbi:MAG: hypothetical protein ACYDBH_24270, partial [Acidobacteriaceae bacterium]
CLALYLRQYPGISISYDGKAVDPKTLEEYAATYQLTVELPTKENIAAELTVIEWKCPIDRALYLCDGDGFARDEHPAGIQARGFNFTAYLKSELVNRIVEENTFGLGELDANIKILLDAAKGKLKTHFRERESFRSSNLVKQWQEEEIYPYKTITTNPIELAEREVFNVCATKVYEYAPSFESSEKRSQQLTFRLIREAIESNPTSLQAILREVLALPQDQQDELASILERTKLAAIISAARVVMNRLDFIGSLDSLLFGEYKQALNEPRHLHRILADELWLFGEQYAMGVDEESLKNLLRAHIALLGRDEIVGAVKDVKDLDGKDRRLDLMLFSRYPQGLPNSFEHLVIELKRPFRKIGKEEISQIEEYAFKVADDERFDKKLTRWTFLLIGNELDTFAQNKCKVSDREFGHIHTGDVNIHVKQWSSIISQAKWRYEFFRDKLEFQVTTADGLAYLRRKHADRLPEVAEGKGVK